MELNNVFFDLGRSKLKKESFLELDKLAKMLKSNTTIKIEVGGHTEVGHTDKQLSQDRADAVKYYLVKTHKISESRITSIGYADTQPKTKSTSFDKRGKNRRVEVKIFKK